MEKEDRESIRPLHVMLYASLESEILSNLENIYVILESLHDYRSLEIREEPNNTHTRSVTHPYTWRQTHGIGEDDLLKLSFRIVLPLKEDTKTRFTKTTTDLSYLVQFAESLQQNFKVLLYKWITHIRMKCASFTKHLLAYCEHLFQD